jgi:hypothetical protein
MGDNGGLEPMAEVGHWGVSKQSNGCAIRPVNASRIFRAKHAAPCIAIDSGACKNYAWAAAARVGLSPFSTLSCSSAADSRPNQRCPEKRYFVSVNSDSTDTL